MSIVHSSPATLKDWFSTIPDNAIIAISVVPPPISIIILPTGSSTLIPIPSLTTYSAQIYGLLVFLGIIVGSFIQVTGKDSQTFLMAGAILVIVSKFGMESVVGSLPNQHHPSAIRRVAQAVIAALLLGKGVIPNRGKFWSKVKLKPNPIK